MHFPEKNRKPDYDAIIIGAGIGGLVCGCYLAKAGMKVLIAEQHFKPGGYCSSFRRGAYVFDAAAHCFGGYRTEGVTRRIFEDLALDKVLKIVQANPSNIVTTPEYRIGFWIDPQRTLDDLLAYFPSERKNIENFFSFLANPDICLSRAASPSCAPSSARRRRRRPRPRSTTTKRPRR